MVRSSGHRNARRASSSPVPRMPPTHSAQKLWPHGSVTGALPSPSEQKSRRHTTHFRSSFSFCLITAEPGDAGVAAAKTRADDDGAFDGVRLVDLLAPIVAASFASFADPPGSARALRESSRARAGVWFLRASRLRSTSAATAARMPPVRATAMGVLPSAFRAARFAPSASSTSTHRASPRSHAMCRGVFPSAFARDTSTRGASQASSRASGTRVSALTASRCPPCAARSSATDRNDAFVAGETSGGHEPSASARTVAASPAAAAATSAARYAPLSRRAASLDGGIGPARARRMRGTSRRATRKSDETPPLMSAFVRAAECIFLHQK